MLRRAAGNDGGPLEPVDGPGVGLRAVVLDDPGGHQLGGLGFHLLGPLGEEPSGILRHACKFGVPLGGRAPGHPETPGQLGSQGSGVDPADRALLPLEKPGVEGQPLPRRVLHLGRDDGVRVQLGIGTAAGVLAEESDN